MICPGCMVTGEQLGGLNQGTSQRQCPKPGRGTRVRFGLAEWGARIQSPEAVFDSSGCCTKLPQPGWFKQQTRILSQFWRLRIQNQGAIRAVLLLRLSVESFLASPGGGRHPWRSPACSCLTPICLCGHRAFCVCHGVFSGCSPPMSLSPVYIKTPVTVG